MSTVPLIAEHCSANYGAGLDRAQGHPAQPFCWLALQQAAICHAQVVVRVHLDDVGAGLDARHERLRDGGAPHDLDPALVLVLRAQDRRAGEQARIDELEQLAHVVGGHLVEQEVVDDEQLGLLEPVEEPVVAAVERSAGHEQLVDEVAHLVVLDLVAGAAGGDAEGAGQPGLALMWSFT